MHVLENRTTRSPELMQLLRRLWKVIDTAGIQLTVRWLASKENTLADALSRGSPFDDLTISFGWHSQFTPSYSNMVVFILTQRYCYLWHLNGFDFR